MSAKANVSLKTRVFRGLRLGWVLVAILLFLLIAIRGETAETAFVMLALMSYPAGLLADMFVPFPVRIEGLPDPSVVVVPLMTGVLGFVQWFVVVPWLAGRAIGWRAKAPLVVNVLLLLVIWIFVEIGAITASVPLNRFNATLGRHLGAIVFHLWLAIPAAVAGAAGAVAAARLFSAQDATLWIAGLAGLLLCAAALTQATLVLGAGCDRVGPVAEVVMPALVCFAVGVYAVRRRVGTAGEGLQ